MQTRLFRQIALAAAIPAAMAVTRAQDKQNMFNPVNTSVTSLAIAPDARAGAMGDVGAATEADVNSQYWNPAKYPFNIARAGLGVSYTPWLRKLVNDINLANNTTIILLFALILLNNNSFNFGSFGSSSCCSRFI